MPPDDPARVTLVITTHDRHEYLEEALGSARAQTYGAVDLVVADDGSTDPRLLRLLERIEADGVRVLRCPPRGVSATLNSAFASTEGTYVMRLDDDDVIAPAYIEQAVRAAASDPRIGVVYCRAELFGTEEGPWSLPDLDLGALLIDNQVFATALFRREDWRAVGGYDESMREGREDHDFLLKVLGLGREVHRLEGTYFRYRRHDGPSLNAVTGRSTPAKARAYAAMLRNNQALYVEHAEEFWLHVFRQLEEARDLRLRYRHLEQLRRRWPRLYGAARTGRRTAEHLAGRLRRDRSPR